METVVTIEHPVRIRQKPHREYAGILRKLVSAPIRESVMFFITLCLAGLICERKLLLCRC